MPKSLRWILIGVLTTAGVAGMVLLARTLVRPKSQITLEMMGPLLRANILSPFPGAETPAGTPLMIEAAGFGGAPLATLQLWADGILVDAVQPPPDDGHTSLHAIFAWAPGSPGPHVAMVRVVDRNGASAESAPLLIQALKPDLIEDGKQPDDDQTIPSASGWGAEGPPSGGVPDIEPLPAAPQAPGPGDDVGPAGPWNPPIFELPGAPGGHPAAPELTAAAQGCATVLTIHDLSDNEEGFRVYRQIPASPAWVLVDTLAGQSAVAYLTYTDPGIPGHALYKVLSFNTVGQTHSNMVSVKVEPSDCSSPAGQPQLYINLNSLESDLPADLKYCYASLGGHHWTRLPAVGFFEQGAVGVDNPTGLASLALELLGESGPPMYSLDLDCWGWLAGALTHLGMLHLDPEDFIFPGALDLIGDGLMVNLDLFVQPPITPLDWDLGDAFHLGNPYAVGGDPAMPYVFALVTYNPASCGEHTPSGGSHLLENLLFCTPYPEFSLDTQPYLIWWVLWGTCPAGSGADCYTQAELQQAADQNGGTLGFTVHDCDETTLCYLHYLPLSLSAFVVPPFTTCSEDRALVVQLAWRDADGYDIVASQGSPPFMLSNPCPQPYETAGYVLMDVEFDQLTLDNVDDGEPAPQDVEIYGWFHVASDTYGGYLTLGEWGWSESGCAGSETFSGSLNLEGSVGECPAWVKNGTYNLSDLLLCQSTQAGQCFLWPQNVETLYGNNNNHLFLQVKEDEAIHLAVKLVDYDEGSDHDTVCSAQYVTSSRTLSEWSQVHGTWNLTHGDNGNALCAVSVHLNAVGP